MLVVNVAYRQNTPANAQPALAQDENVPGWSLLFGFAVGLVALLIAGKMFQQ
jgi:hypothetical protein